MRRECRLAVLQVALLAAAHGQQDSDVKPLAQRIADRLFPSVFQAWNGAENLKEDPEATIARHDLYWHVPEGFGLQWDDTYPGAAKSFRAVSVVSARALRQRLLARNPNIVLLASIYYRDAPPNGSSLVQPGSRACTAALNVGQALLAASPLRLA